MINDIIKFICRAILAILITSGIMFMLVACWPYLEIAIILLVAGGFIINKAFES